MYSRSMKIIKPNHIILNTDEFYKTSDYAIDIVTCYDVSDDCIVIVKLLDNKVMCCWNVSTATTQNLLEGRGKLLDIITLYNDIQFDNVIVICVNFSIDAIDMLFPKDRSTFYRVLKGPHIITYNNILHTINSKNIYHYNYNCSQFLVHKIS